MSPCLYGSHTGQEYSKSDRTIEKYAISFNFEGHPFEFLLKKPSVELALLAILGGGGRVSPPRGPPWATS